MSEENGSERVRSGMKLIFFALYIQSRGEWKAKRKFVQPTSARKEKYNWKFSVKLPCGEKNVFTDMSLTIIRFSFHSDQNTWVRSEMNKCEKCAEWKIVLMKSKVWRKLCALLSKRSTLNGSRKCQFKAVWRKQAVWVEDNSFPRPKWRVLLHRSDCFQREIFIN